MSIKEHSPFCTIIIMKRYTMAKILQKTLLAAFTAISTFSGHATEKPEVPKEQGIEPATITHCDFAHITPQKIITKCSDASKLTDDEIKKTD